MRRKFKASEINAEISPYFDRPGTSDDSSNNGSPAKKRARPNKYGGMSEEDVMKLLLPDRVAENLDILFIGINPGLTSAYKGHHYAGPNNHFWPCLYDSGLVPEKLTFRDDEKCPAYGIGLTNIVERTTRGSSDLSRKEIKDGVDALIVKVKRLKPLVACFNGKGIYEIFSKSKCEIGRQTKCIPGTNVVVYVMPSSSGRTMTYPRASDKLKFFTELKSLRDEAKLKTLSADADKPKTDNTDTREKKTLET
ncbi:G/T mismatch-specific thymine DNA glycosylase [Nematostella vectensis]|uniref:G/T mismatch-specific thymine DNA glycosylase n=1 Tax=Nematostella vectensis TaxID=45351 RepID=UPI0020772F58|nr:G/T mismatch-specific thymine DNA glycosylase [Nematostella vectensis]